MAAAAADTTINPNPVVSPRPVSATAEN
jgi:hypothetical protein